MKMTMEQATVTCPVCGLDLTVWLEVKKVIYERIGPDSVRLTAGLHATLPEFEDPSTHPAGHEACFTVTDEDRKFIADYEARRGASRGN